MRLISPELRFLPPSPKSCSWRRPKPFVADFEFLRDTSRIGDPLSILPNLLFTYLVLFCEPILQPTRKEQFHIHILIVLLHVRKQLAPIPSDSPPCYFSSCSSYHSPNHFIYRECWNKRQIRTPHQSALGSDLIALVEHSGLEPLTSTLPVWHSTSWANAPRTDVLYHKCF